MADEILVPHASLGGEVESECREIFASTETTLDSAINVHLLALGARVFSISKLNVARESPR